MDGLSRFGIGGVDPFILLICVKNGMVEHGSQNRRIESVGIGGVDPFILLIRDWGLHPVLKRSRVELVYNDLHLEYRRCRL